MPPRRMTFLRDIPRVTIPDEYSRHAGSQHRLWFIWYIWHHLTGTRRRPPWMDIVCGDVDGGLWLLEDEDEECIKEFVIYLAVYYSFDLMPAQMPMVDWNDASRALDARLSQTILSNQLAHVTSKTRLRVIAWLVVVGPLRKDRILRDEGVPTIERLIHHWAMSMGLFRDGAETCEICSVSHLLPLWIETLVEIYSLEDLGSLPWGPCDCLESHLAVALASTWPKRKTGPETQVGSTSLVLRLLYELVVPRWPLIHWVAFRTVVDNPVDHEAFLKVLSRGPDQDLFIWDPVDESELCRVLAKGNMYTQDWNRYMLEIDLQNWLRIGSTTWIARRIRHRSDDMKIRLVALLLTHASARIATRNIFVQHNVNIDSLFTSKPAAFQNILAPLNVSLNNFLFISIASVMAEDYQERSTLTDLESVEFWASSNLTTWLLTQSEKLCRTIWHASPRSSLSERVQDMYLAFNRLPRNLVMYTYSLVQQSNRHGEAIQFPDIADQWESGFLASFSHYCVNVKKLLSLLKQGLQTRAFSTTIATTVYEHMNRDLCAVVARLVLFLRDPESYKKFLMCSGKEVQRLLDLLQNLLDLDSFAVVKPTLFQALLRLSRSSGVQPRCFALSGLQKVGQQVTGGSFGDIWKGLVRGQSVCVKVMRVFEDSDIEDALKEFGREALIWRQLCHPNVLPFFGVYYLEGRPCLVSPWMEDGHIMKFLKTNEPDDAERLSLILDVAQGLEYLHEQKIVHGDLKGLNILVTPSRRACIADFGVSTIANTMTVRFTHSTGTHSRAGTSRYLAPELFRMDNPAQIHPGSDVYAFACVCYEILTGKVPFYELPNDMAVMMRVAGGQRPQRQMSCSGTTSLDGLWELMQKCWDGKVELRPTASEVVKSLSGPLIGARTKPIATDWDEESTSKFRRSLQAEPLLPSVAQIEHILLGD
ncbi:Protein kinase domain-containing protein [Mycena sanguinolenta]|uniref:Protein kinase domain-containing protein n=1 Tax=Mycena sanguinolenta TaxID=230812 RepID=A0A8H6ZHQ7_9AGAR|nr:Protein kinase domain-containing protein [Mycena sanguinolenta]